MLPYILLAVIALQEVLHRMERKDLYNRIMAKDFQEYRPQNHKRMGSSIKNRLEALKQQRKEI